MSARLTLPFLSTFRRFKLSPPSQQAHRLVCLLQPNPRYPHPHHNRQTRLFSSKAPMAKMMKLYFDDAEMDGQLQRSLIAANAGAADLGEVMATAAKITPGSYDR